MSQHHLCGELQIKPSSLTYYYDLIHLFNDVVLTSLFVVFYLPPHSALLLYENFQISLD